MAESPDRLGAASALLGEDHGIEDLPALWRSRRAVVDLINKKLKPLLVRVGIEFGEPRLVAGHPDNVISVYIGQPFAKSASMASCMRCEYGDARI